MRSAQQSCGHSRCTRARTQDHRAQPIHSGAPASGQALDSPRQKALNNPRETYAAWLEHRRDIGDPEAKNRPAPRSGRQKLPSLLEQVVALEEQIVMLEESLEEAERSRAYFAEMMQAIAKEAKLDDDAVAEIRAKVRAARAEPTPPGGDVP
jgi:exonuclease VII small subunit